MQYTSCLKIMVQKKILMKAIGIGSHDRIGYLNITVLSSIKMLYCCLGSVVVHVILNEQIRSNKIN